MEEDNALLPYNNLLSVLYNNTLKLNTVINQFLGLKENNSPFLTQIDIISGKYTIAIVDDDPINLMIREEQLKIAGYNIITATSGTEFLDLLQDNLKINLIILDIFMPELNGFEVCQEIRKKYSKDKLPVLFCSASILPADIEKVYSCGGNGYLNKPVTKAMLLANIQNFIK